MPNCGALSHSRWHRSPLVSWSSYLLQFVLGTTLAFQLAQNAPAGPRGCKTSCILPSFLELALSAYLTHRMQCWVKVCLSVATEFEIQDPDILSLFQKHQEMVLNVLKLTAPKINGDDLSILWREDFCTSWLAEFIEPENLNGLGWKEP